MEDDSEYTDDYFDQADSEYNQADRDDRDEQKDQKVSGHIESLEMKIHELQSELTIEKEKNIEFNDILKQSRSTDEDIQLSIAKTDKETSSASLIEEKNNIKNQSQRPISPNSLSISTKMTGANPTIATEDSTQLIHDHSQSDVDGLKQKIFHMAERIRVEKENKYKVEQELKNSKKKVNLLTDHMEKLIIHLKREASNKVRLSEQVKVLEKENIRLALKYDTTVKKNASKDRLIYELREGSKVLEDQLRLMDEKYLELRAKLDYARSEGNKKLKKAQKVAKELRMKFAMSGSHTLLDNMPMPGLDHMHGHQLDAMSWNSAPPMTSSAYGAAAVRDTDNPLKKSVTIQLNDINTIGGLRKSATNVEFYMKGGGDGSDSVSLQSSSTNYSNISKSGLNATMPNLTNSNKMKPQMNDMMTAHRKHSMVPIPSGSTTSHSPSNNLLLLQPQHYEEHPSSSPLSISKLNPVAVTHQQKNRTSQQQQQQHNVDDVLEKIRVRQGAKVDWSEERVKKLTTTGGNM